jgi:hypothetical protein
MLPRRLQQQHPLEAAEAAARCLSSLLQDPEVSQQLQQSPAAALQPQQQQTKLTARGTVFLVQLKGEGWY